MVMVRALSAADGGGRTPGGEQEPGRIRGYAMSTIAAAHRIGTGGEDRGILRPGRRRLLVGAGTVGLSLVLGTGAAQASHYPSRGWRGTEVAAIQRRLWELKYWCGSADGSFGHLTQQAVWALQKAAGLSQDGVVGPNTRSALDRGVRPSRRITSGTGIEIDVGRDLMIFTWNGSLSYIMNTSTGRGERYYSGGRWKTAYTPLGDYRVFRRYSSGWQSGPLGDLYRPIYFHNGWAIHGSYSIPPYPASHGCARVSTSFMNRLWDRGWCVDGRRVLTY